MLLTNYIEPGEHGATLNLARSIQADALDFKRSFDARGASAKDCARAFDYGIELFATENIKKIRLPYFDESFYFVQLLEKNPKDTHYEVELVIPVDVEISDVSRALFDDFSALPNVSCSLVKEQLTCVAVDEDELASSFSSRP